MKTKNIEFETSYNGLIGVDGPWKSRSVNRYQDLILKDEYRDRRMKFPIGKTWIRILPALKGSNSGWMLGVHSLSYKGGRHAHPRTIKAGSKCVFDEAYEWLVKHKPDTLYSKNNREGYRLLADPMCLFWIITEINGKPVARLFLGSGYDGSRGGVAGLGYQIYKIGNGNDGNAVDPEKGFQICVEKVQNTGSRYPGYTLSIDKTSTPADDLIEIMDPDEVEAIIPLDSVVNIPSEEEEWKLLENVVDADTIGEIRSSSEETEH